MQWRQSYLSVCVGLLLLSGTNLATGQILQPAKWSTSTSVEEAKVGDVVELVFTAKLDDTWYIYSHDQDANLGPMPAYFDFEKNASYKLIGPMRAINVHEKYDDIWGGNVRILEEKAEFRQKVKILKENFELLVYLEYQVCTTVDGKCVPGDEEFEFNYLNVGK